MADTQIPAGSDTLKPLAPRGADRRGRKEGGRRRTDVTPRAETAARRTRIIQMVILAVAAVVTIDSLVGEKGLIQTYRARRDYSQMVGGINRLKQDNARLRDRARRLKEDPAAIEELARRNLGLVKPGEVLIILRDQK